MSNNKNKSLNCNIYKSINKINDQIQLETSHNALLFTYKWFSFVRGMFMIFMIVYCSYFVSKDYLAFDSFEAFFTFSPLIYLGLIEVFNKTQIHVTNKYIQIQHKPFPWFGNKVIYVENISQLYCKRLSFKNNVEFGVYVQQKVGRDIKLFASFRTSEQALLVEQEIENFLKIENIQVTGEIGS